MHHTPDSPAAPPMQHEGGHGPAAPGDREPMLMMVQHHAMTRWADFVLLGLGAWLVTAPGTLGYRSPALVWSDVLSGLIVAALAGLAVWRGWAVAAWAVSLPGVWLVFAPIVFWAREPAAYANDTVVGTLLIAFSVLIPHGMDMEGHQVPAGWSYNPSTWAQRLPIVALGLIGFFLSRYMAAYQLGHIGTVWDPIFGGGTVQVLESSISKMFPVSDSGLGASVYLLEVLMTLMGDPRRWRTMPWMVAFFAILVVPLGVTSIVLVILQPLAVGAWCGPCLVAALAMLVMVPLTLDEVVAMGQYLVQSRRAGRSLWRTFWLGGNDALGEPAKPTRPVDASSPVAGLWGVSYPWTVLAAALLGGWLLLAPALLGSEGTKLANSDRLVGALVITWALIALAEVARAVRYLNVPLGLWLLAAPFVLGAGFDPAAWSGIITGLLLVGLSLPRGSVRERYGGFSRYVV